MRSLDSSLADLNSHLDHIPISGPPATPNATAWLERGLQCLGDTGLAEGQKLSVILLVSGFVRNYATMVADLSTSFLASSPAQDAMANYGRLLARLTDPQRFPALHAAIASGAFDEPTSQTTSSSSAWNASSTASTPWSARGPERPPPGCSPSVTTPTRAGGAHPAVHLNPRGSLCC